MKYLIGFVLLGGLLVALPGCDSSLVTTPGLVPEPTDNHIILSPTLPATETMMPPSPTMTVAPSMTAESPPVTSTSAFSKATEIPACVLLHYGEYAQFEIIGPSGQRIFVDVFDPEKISDAAVEGDVLLTTHTHWDHWNEDFQSTFPGQQLFREAGLLETPGVIIQGIASAHNAGERLKPEGGSNYIYLIEMGGLRIAHFGDIGQQTLTNEQMAVLGEVDIAISQINNPYSEMNAENRKGIKLMTQISPRLVIPTHLNLDTVKLAASQWDGYIRNSSIVRICESNLDQDGTMLLVMGESAGKMVNYVDLKVWDDSVPIVSDQD